MQNTVELHRRLSYTSLWTQHAVMMSASLSFEVKHYDINRACFQETIGETHLHLTFAEDRQKHDPSVESMCGTQYASHIWQLGGANCIGGVNVFVCSKDECFKFGKQTQIVPQSKSRCENGTLSACLLDDDGFKHIDIQIQRRSERHGRIPGFKDSNLRPDSMMKTETMSTPRQRLQHATPV